MCRSAFTDLNNNGCLSVTCLSKTNNLHMTSENGLQPVERPSRGLLRDCTTDGSFAALVFTKVFPVEMLVWGVGCV